MFDTACAVVGRILHPLEDSFVDDQQLDPYAGDDAPPVCSFVSAVGKIDFRFVVQLIIVLKNGTPQNGKC